METEYFIVIGVFPVELLTYQVSMVFAANWQRELFLYTRCNIAWAECMTSSVISFAKALYFVEG